MRILLIIMSFFILLGCSEIKEPEHKDPPPGWSIVCTIDGYYGVKDPSGYILNHYYGRDGKPPKTRQGAIDRAWGQYEFRNPPKYDWKECENKENKK